MTMAVLETRAKEIFAEHGVEGFVGSPGFIQRCSSQERLKRVKLWGQAGSAAQAFRQGDRCMAEKLSELATTMAQRTFTTWMRPVCSTGVIQVRPTLLLGGDGMCADLRP